MNASLNWRPEDERAQDIAALVGRLAQQRAVAQKRRYRGPAPKLPARETIIGLIDELAAALYPRHFGPQGLEPQEIDVFVGASLTSALTALQGQVALELALDDADVEPTGRDAAIVAAFASRLSAVRALADSDVRAGFEGDPSATSIDEIIFCFPGFAAVLRHRLAHQLYKLNLPMIARIIAEDAHARTGIDIHPGAEIGGRFFIDHGTGVVIGETAVIGENVRLYQAVTLGARRFEIDRETGALRKNYPRHPIVDDDVVIYAGATILGRIVIGKGSSIGGNVWLTHNVAPGSRISAAAVRSAADGAPEMPVGGSDEVL
jgi:serine O-acetyltransferase